MKARIAIIAAGALLCGGLLTLTTGAFAETTPNNSGRQLENVQEPQSAGTAGAATASVRAPRKSKVRQHR
jgi:hypothetical protein